MFSKDIFSIDFFSKATFEFTTRRFFLFLKVPMRVQKCRVLSCIIHFAVVTAFQTPEETCLDPATEYILLDFSDTR